MQIRYAEMADTLALTELYKSFHSQERKGFPLNANSAALMINYLIATQVLWVLVDNKKIVGMLGGAIVPFISDPSKSHFQELVWYIVPKCRIKGTVMMLHEMETYCRKLKADYAVISHGDNKTFKSKGYKLYETYYQKRLS